MATRGLLLIGLFICQGPCGANFNTGSTETASRFTEIRGNGPLDDPTFLIENEINRSYPANFLTSPDTTRATNAEIIISLK
jgi:hypothetical protein